MQRRSRTQSWNRSASRSACLILARRHFEFLDEADSIVRSEIKRIVKLSASSKCNAEHEH